MMISCAEQKPSVFEYDDYRLFLKDLYEFYKSSTTHFSYRYFSQRAGFSSPNFLKLVIDGKRNLSKESIERFVRALKLSQSEGAFFESLVNFCQSQDGEVKAKAAMSLLESRTFRKTHPLKEAELKYYANWYYIPIRELIGTPHFREEPEWIATRFRPALQAAQVKEALSDLEKLNLIQRDANGRFTQTHENVSTMSEVTSTLVAQYHRKMMSLGAESIDRVERTRREISGTCISCSPKTMLKIKQMVRNFRREVLAVASEDQDSDMICQLNFQLFPLIEINWEESE